jgi:predicted nucleic acid-binding protein
MERLNGKKIAIDTMLMIYLLEQNPIYMTTVVNIFEHAGTIVCSAFLLGELFAGFYRKGEGEKADLVLRYMEDAGSFEILPFDEAQALLFAKIRGAHPVYSAPDCIHLSAALQSGADVFVTNDKQLKTFEGLKVVYLQDLLE